jgi:hypothetical protein
MDAPGQWADDWSPTESQNQDAEHLTPRAALAVIAALSLGVWSAIGLAAASIFEHLW